MVVRSIPDIALPKHAAHVASVLEARAGIVRLVIGAAEVDDLGVDTPEAGSAWTTCGRRVESWRGNAHRR
jgi:hypothetical protein